MKGAGIGLIVVGVVVMGGALLFQPTVETDGLYGAPSQVYNLGAMQYQELFFIGGAALLVAGCILFGFGELIESLVRAGTAKAAPEELAAPALPVNKCGWCERTLGPEYRTCTSFPPIALTDLAPKIKDPICLEQLRERQLIGPAE